MVANYMVGDYSNSFLTGFIQQQIDPDAKAYSQTSIGSKGVTWIGMQVKGLEGSRTLQEDLESQAT